MPLFWKTAGGAPIIVIDIAMKTNINSDSKASNSSIKECANMTVLMFATRASLLRLSRTDHYEVDSPMAIYERVEEEELELA